MVSLALRKRLAMKHDIFCLQETKGCREFMRHLETLSTDWASVRQSHAQQPQRWWLSYYDDMNVHHEPLPAGRYHFVSFRTGGSLLKIFRVHFETNGSVTLSRCPLVVR